MPKKLKDLVKFSGIGNLTSRRIPGYYQSARRLLATKDTGLINKRLKKILARAARTAGGRQYAGRELSAWPVMDKATLRSSSDGFVTSRWGPRSKSATSGSSGVPLQLVRGPSSIAFEQAAIDLAFGLAGVDMLRDRIAVLRGDVIKAPDDVAPPFWKLGGDGKRLYLSGPHLSPTNLTSIVAELRRFRPKALYAYPSTAASLARLCRAANLTLEIPLVVTSSEAFLEPERQLVASTFGAMTVDYYGQGERVALAISHRPGEYWFNPGYGVVELQPVGEGRAEIVATGLGNLLQPLVRYRTGDLALVGDADSQKLSEIATGKRPFEGVVGRIGDFFLVGANGETIMGLDGICRDVPEVERMQIIQTADHVELRVIAGPSFGPPARQKLEENASRRLPSSVNWSVQVVEELERNPSGKIPFIIRR